MKWFNIALFLLCGSLNAQSEKVNFKRIHELVKATEQESVWKDRINWQIDLWKARQIANKERKPILIWEMDGHPMGCT